MDIAKVELVKGALQSGPLTVSQIYDRLNGKGWPERTDAKIRYILEGNEELFEKTGKKGYWRGAKWQIKKATVVKTAPQKVQSCECDCAGCNIGYHCGKTSRGCNW